MLIAGLAVVFRPRRVFYSPRRQALPPKALRRDFSRQLPAKQKVRRHTTPDLENTTKNSDELFQVVL